MRATLLAKILTTCAGLALLADAPVDTAVIVGSASGSRPAYRIEVSSDGSGSITPAQSGSGSFTIPEGIVERFFTAVAASYNDRWTGRQCGNGRTIRVKWHGWTSGDVTCPPSDPDYTVMRDAVMLNNTVLQITVLAGPPASVPRSELPQQPPSR